MKEHCREILARAYLFLDGEGLNEAERIEIEVHLEECVPCLDSFDLQMDVNVKALVIATRESVEMLKAAGGHSFHGPDASGDASARCGISMKGVDIVVRGSVGHMSAFMAQKGCLVVCGDAGDALGDSIYEAHLYVRGSVAGLGAAARGREVVGADLLLDERVLLVAGLQS